MQKLPTPHILYTLTLLIITAFPLTDAFSSADTARKIRVLSIQAEAGERVAVPIEITSVGNESAILFTLRYDPAFLSRPSVSLGESMPTDSVLTANDTNDGLVRVLVDSGHAFLPGRYELATVYFYVSLSASGSSDVALENTSIATTEAYPLNADYFSGTVTLTGAFSPSISGRLLTPDGFGLKNAKVILSGPDGRLSYCVTGSMGYFEFQNVTIGPDLVLSVESRRYRYLPVQIQATTYVDLVGIE